MGRPKGALNKRTLLGADVLFENKFCPIKRGIEIYERALEAYEEAPNKPDAFRYLEIAQREIADLRAYAYSKQRPQPMTLELGKETLNSISAIAKAVLKEPSK